MIPAARRTRPLIAMEGSNHPMSPIRKAASPRPAATLRPAASTGALAFLSISAALVFTLSAAPAVAGSASADAPAPAAVEEKFRKFQKEMAKDGPGSSAGLADAPAAGGTEASPATDPEPPGLVSFSLQLLVGLAVVIVLAVFSIRGLKGLQNRMLARPGKVGAGGDLFEVLETCHLGSNQRVVALRIHDEVGVIGVSPQGISLLTVLKHPAEDIRKARLGTGNPAAFSDNLNKLLDRFKKPKRVSDLLDEQGQT